MFDLIDITKMVVNEMAEYAKKNNYEAYYYFKNDDSSPIIDQKKRAVKDLTIESLEDLKCLYVFIKINNSLEIGMNYFGIIENGNATDEYRFYFGNTYMFTDEVVLNDEPYTRLFKESCLEKDRYISLSIVDYKRLRVNTFRRGCNEVVFSVDVNNTLTKNTLLSEKKNNISSTKSQLLIDTSITEENAQEIITKAVDEILKFFVGYKA